MEGLWHKAVIKTPRKELFFFQSGYSTITLSHSATSELLTGHKYLIFFVLKIPESPSGAYQNCVLSLMNSGSPEQEKETALKQVGLEPLEITVVLMRTDEKD